MGGAGGPVVGELGADAGRAGVCVLDVRVEGGRVRVGESVGRNAGWEEPGGDARYHGGRDCDLLMEETRRAGDRDGGA